MIKLYAQVNIYKIKHQLILPYFPWLTAWEEQLSLSFPFSVFSRQQQPANTQNAHSVHFLDEGSNTKAAVLPTARDTFCRQNGLEAAARHSNDSLHFTLVASPCAVHFGQQQTHAQDPFWAAASHTIITKIHTQMALQTAYIPAKHAENAKHTTAPFVPLIIFSLLLTFPPRVLKIEKIRNKLKRK